MSNCGQGVLVLDHGPTLFCRREVRGDGTSSHNYQLNAEPRTDEFDAKNHNGKMPTRSLPYGSQMLAYLQYLGMYLPNQPYSKKKKKKETREKRHLTSRKKHKDKVSIYSVSFMVETARVQDPCGRQFTLLVWKIVRYSRLSDRHGQVPIS